MAQFDAYFKRYEKKYLLSPEQYEKLRQRLPEHFEPDRFHLSEISNIYFDTPTNRTIKKNSESGFTEIRKPRPKRFWSLRKSFTESYINGVKPYR